VLRRRLTLLYCLVSVVSGVVLIVIMWALAVGLGQSDVRMVPEQQPVADQPVRPVPGAPLEDPAEIPADRPAVPVPQRTEFDAEMLVLPGLALAIMAVLSLLVGWVVAGRMLRPVLTMTERLHRISDRNMHERLSMPGPRNELKDLADTVDGLLGRLESALDAQKRFVANAAHELRTPLTIERALLEEPLIDDAASLESYRENFDRLLTITDQRTQLLESLLTLAGSEQAPARVEPVDVGALVERTLRDRVAEVARGGLTIESTVPPVRVPGDEVLLARLLANLVDNALHYNVPGGTVEITGRRRVGRFVVAVTNTGQVVPADQVDRLFEPFQRLNRAADDSHHGLGLSIVRAIASVHGAKLTARANPTGGLHVEVAFALA
jgi:signal transduction histidine kinase